MRIAAVTGLAAEARIARRAGLIALATGGDGGQTAAAAQRLLDAGATHLLSFGVAGGLDPRLPPGTLLLPRRICAEGGTAYAVDAPWRAQVDAALHSAGLAAVPGDLLSVARAVAAPAEKARLFVGGAVAVDLESHLVAAAAARAGLAFVALRAVADPAGRALPAAALIPLDEMGRPRIGAVLRSLLGAPGQLSDLFALARDTRRALAALRRAAAAVYRTI